MAAALPLPGLRQAATADLTALAALYAQCARRCGPQVYDEAQVRAWAGFADDRVGFADYVLGAETWLAQADDGALLGFCGCDDQGEVRSLYVQPDDQRRGLGGALLAHVLQRAAERGIAEQAAWVTPLSRGLFLRHGFRWTQTVQSPFGGTLFERYRVQRP